MSEEMMETRRWVEIVLYGSGSLQRFTQHSPILGDVWAAYFDDPGKAIDLLIQPWRDQPPYEVVEALLNSIDQQSDGRSTAGADITCNKVTVVATLSLRQLIVNLVPLSDWYRKLPEDSNAATSKSKPGKGFLRRLPAEAELWADVFTSKSRTYPYPKALSMVRMAGLIAHIQLHGRGGVDDDLRALTKHGNAGEAERARASLAKKILTAFRESIASELPLPGKASLVYAINRNRPAMLAMKDSTRAVKADAARSLFKIDCSKITWAIIDSGIDARHPAFRLKPQPGSGRTIPAGLAGSRVRRTFDFSYLREILLGKRGPGRQKGESLKAFEERKKSWQDIVERIRIQRAVDWQLLLPLVEIKHTAYIPPKDSHGTHVAGILAADLPDRAMVGLCPDIQLIDMRVIREDGSSDEFVIMAALQFLRYLNANADFMAVHGVNMSLSLVHDAANYACGQTPVCLEAERATASGVVVVAAAGNLGFRRMFGARDSISFDQYCSVSITDPGNAEDVITVGSTHRLEPHTYGVSYFSSRGPTGDGRIKPDLVAPGEKIFGPVPEEGETTLDGTSMAAPHVSGAAALLMARHVELTGRPRRIKQILCDTATDLGRERYFQGHGLVDVLRAIQSV